MPAGSVANAAFVFRNAWTAGAESDAGTGCFEKSLITVGMNFQQYDGWMVSFLEADMRTTLPWSKVYATTDPLYEIVRKSYLPAAAERDLEQCLSAWGRGTVKLRITAMQHLALMKPAATRR